MSLLHAKYAVYKSLPWYTTECCVFHQKCHEIHWISPWNPLDFMVLYFSSEPIQIYKSLPWNPPNFTMKSAGFHGHSSEPKALAWNLPDFMKSAKFHEIQMSQGPMVLFFVSSFFLLHSPSSWSSFSTFHHFFFISSFHLHLQAASLIRPKCTLAMVCTLVMVRTAAGIQIAAVKQLSVHHHS